MPTGCAALLSPRGPSLALRAIHLVPRLRRVAGLCSSNVSDTANRLLKRADSEGSSSVAEKKILCRSPISQRSHIGNLRRANKQGKGRSSKRKGNRRCPFLFAPAAGAATLPPSADGESPAESQRKTSRPLGANTLTQFAYPAQPVQKKDCRPDRANTLTQFVYPAKSVQKSLLPGKGVLLTQFVYPGQPVQKKTAARIGRSAYTLRVPCKIRAELTNQIHLIKAYPKKTALSTQEKLQNVNNLYMSAHFAGICAIRIDNHLLLL